MRARLILLAAWLGAFLAGFDFAALYVAIPSIAAELGVGLSATSWVVIAYTLVFVGFTISVGTLSERFGMRRMLIAGFAIFGLLSIPCALARDIFTLAGARSLQALGGSILYVMGPAVVRGLIPPDAQDRAFGLFTFAPYVGLSLGPALGGLLVFYLGWPWIFLANLPFCALGLYAVRAIPAQPAPGADKSPPSIDVRGTILGFTFLAFLTLALNQGREWGWTSGPVLGCLLGFLVTFALFLWWERRSPHGALDLGLFGNRVFALSTLSIFLLLFVGAGARFLFPIHVQWLEGLSVHHAGFALMAMAVGLGVTSLQSQRLAARFPVRDLGIAGLVLAAAGLAPFAIAGPGTSVWIFVLAMGITGLGMGLHYPQAMRLAMQTVAAGDSIRASTALSSVRSVAQLLGIVAFETLFSELYLSPSDPHYGSSTDALSLARMTEGFHSSFAVAAVLCLAALIPLLFLYPSEEEIKPP